MRSFRHVFQRIEKEDVLRGTGFQWPRLRFRVEDQIGMARGGFIDVEEAGNGIEAATDIEFERFGGGVGCGFGGQRRTSEERWLERAHELRSWVDCKAGRSLAAAVVWS